LKLVVESELISYYDHYDLCPTSILRSSNPILTKKMTHSRAREQPPTCVPIQNMDEDEEEEEWHLNVEDDDIQNVIDINMNEIEDEINVEEIVK
jgi:hypothetical protein